MAEPQPFDERAPSAPTVLRPHWHVDAKWVVGLVLTLAFAIVLVVAALWRLSSPDHAIELTTTAAAAMLSPQGLDDPRDITALEAEMRATGARSIDPLGLGLTNITRADLTEHSPREIRLMIFRPLAERLYYEDPETVAADLDLDDAKAFGEQAAVFSALSRDSNRRLGTALLVGLIIVVGGGWMLVRFSSGAGRIVSPSLVVLVAASPGLLAALVAGGIASGGSGDPGEASRIGSAIGEAAPIISAAFLPVFLTAWLAGFAGLIAAAAVRRRHSTA